MNKKKRKTDFGLILLVNRLFWKLDGWKIFLQVLFGRRQSAVFNDRQFCRLSFLRYVPLFRFLCLIA